MSTPKVVRDPAIKKWNRGIKAGEEGDPNEAVKWWEFEGSKWCSYCAFYQSYARGCETCPLNNPSVYTCAAPWWELRRAYRHEVNPADFQKILREQAPKMLQLILDDEEETL